MASLTESGRGKSRTDAEDDFARRKTSENSISCCFLSFCRKGDVFSQRAAALVIECVDMVNDGFV